MALMYISQYLQDGSGFTPISTTNNFQSSTARQVLAQWTSALVTAPHITVNMLQQPFNDAVCPWISLPLNR